MEVEVGAVGGFGAHHLAGVGVADVGVGGDRGALDHHGVEAGAEALCKKKITKEIHKVTRVNQT